MNKMKKILCLTLCALLLCASAVACAETREAVIWLEGEQEPITETRFDCAGLFSFWYDADLYDADDSQSESGHSVLVQNRNINGIIYMELMAPDAVGMDAWDYLEANAAPDTEYDYMEADSGAIIVGYETGFGENGALIAGHYIVEKDEDFVAVYTVCPMDVYEAVRAYFYRVMQTVSFSVQAPVRAFYAEDAALTDGGYDAVSVSEDEPPVKVVFTAEKTVTDFRVLALTLSDEESKTLFDATEVYRQDALTPGRPLLVTMVFYGDIPNNGISYVDEAGETHSFAVDMSGEDGRLLLWAF